VTSRINIPPSLAATECILDNSGDSRNCFFESLLRMLHIVQSQNPFACKWLYKRNRTLEYIKSTNSPLKAPLLVSVANLSFLKFKPPNGRNSECYCLVNMATASHSKLHITSCIVVVYHQKGSSHLHLFLTFSF